MRLLIVGDLGGKAVFNFVLLPLNQRRDALNKGDEGDKVYELERDKQVAHEKASLPLICAASLEKVNSPFFLRPFLPLCWAGITPSCHEASLMLPTLHEADGCSSPCCSMCSMVSDCMKSCLIISL